MWGHLSCCLPQCIFSYYSTKSKHCHLWLPFLGQYVNSSLNSVCGEKTSEEFDSATISFCSQEGFLLRRITLTSKNRDSDSYSYQKIAGAESLSCDRPVGLIPNISMLCL